MIHKKSKRIRKKNTKNKRKSMKGGSCMTLGVESLGLGGYANSYGVPLNVLEFCTLWVNGGNHVCLDQGPNQTDTLYLSKGPYHNNRNHIHLFRFKDGIHCGLKDKRTGQEGVVRLTRDMFVDYYRSWIQKLS
jgi:hypothetical protein